MAKLDIRFYGKCEATSLTGQEKDIARYIYRNSSGEDYSEAIKGDGRYFIRYNFSDYRSAILRWYPFRTGSDVLEINAEYGAMTGALCDACASVTVTEDSLFRARLICDRYAGRGNLTVYAADYRDIGFGRMFDYIVFFRTLETVPDPAEVLVHLKSLLRPGGVLLLETENQYGIQYLAGRKESHSGIPFDSIAGYPGRQSGRGYSRADLDDLLVRSGFPFRRFFYPFPDYIAPRAVYSDEGLPEANITERLTVTYHEGSSYAVAGEEQLFIDCVRNRVYPFVSNHFIVEASGSASALSGVRSCTLSPYRVREKAFATIIRSDGIVQKKGMFPESAGYAAYLQAISDELAKTGVEVLPMRREGNSLFMDFVEADTVQMVLRKLVKSGDRKGAAERIFSIFDRIWENILQSSVLSDRCAFGTGGLDVGPILKKAYAEMVTINSFWTDDGLLFFDQEVVKDDYPARYVLWRSIHLLYGQQPDAEDVIPRKRMLEHYGITAATEELFGRLEAELGESENPYIVFFDGAPSPGQTARNRMKLLECGDGR